jgi:ATP-binding cassette subfamily B protein
MNNQNKKEKLVALRSYLQFCKPYKWKILFVLGIFVVSNISITLLPIFIGKLVEVSTHRNIGTGEIWKYAFILIGLSTFHDLTWRGAEFAYRGLINKISYLYESFLFKLVVNKPYPYFVDKLTGKIGSYITLLGTEFRGLQDNILFDFSGSIVSIVATILILGSLNWQTMLIFVVGILAMVLVGRKTLSLNMKHESIAADKGSSKNGILFDAIANFPSIKALKTEREEFKTINHQQTITYQANQQAFLTGILFWGTMSFFVRHFMWPAAILLNVHFFTTGQMNIGQLATLLSTILIFTTTIWEGVWYISQFGQKMARTDEAYHYLFKNNSETEIETKQSAKPIFKKSIQIKELNFAYPDKPDQNILSSISLDIKKGKKIGIVGRSGSGKSTLTKLLLDYYQTKPNELFIDGKPTSSADFAKLISFVPQDTALFHRTISENIGYGKSKVAGVKEIEKVAKLAAAHDFIKELPDGYETLIGERGVKLSGGQRQRIAIARAIIQDAPLLVLDEATSALDSESEKHIQEALWNLMKDRTAIVIAHRLSTIQKMDRIIVMDKGSIIEEGSHKELLRQDGTYAKLWKHQSGGFIEE